MTVIESATRFVPPQATRRRRRWRRLILLFVVALVVGAACWLVWWSPVLAVREVRVLGAQTVSADQVRDVAGVTLGTPLARVSATDVEARVDSIPVVRSVEVRYGWPDVLVLVVTERTPVAVVSEGGVHRLVDRDAVAYTSVAQAPADLPEVKAAAALTAAVDVLDALPATLRGRVETVRAGSVDDVTLVLRDDTRVRWGGTADAQRKAEVVQALLSQHARVIDVSAPELPTTRGADPGGRSG
jgi:cell division protein FtsQ